MIKRILKEKDDFLNPIVVKEIRQGLRTKNFIGAFIAVQILLLMYLLVSIYSNDPGWSNQIFYGSLEIIFICLMPLSALFVVSDEKKFKTSDMLFISNMTGMKIIWGKFYAITLQIILVSSAVLPYLFMRYFLGRVELAHEIMGFTLLMFSSLCLTAFFVLMSTIFSPKPFWDFVKLGIAGCIIFGVAAFNHQVINEIKHIPLSWFFVIVIQGISVVYIIMERAGSILCEHYNDSPQEYALAFIFGSNFICTLIAVDLIGLFIFIGFVELIGSALMTAFMPVNHYRRSPVINKENMDKVSLKPKEKPKDPFEKTEEKTA